MTPPRTSDTAYPVVPNSAARKFACQDPVEAAHLLQAASELLDRFSIWAHAVQPAQWPEGGSHTVQERLFRDLQDWRDEYRRQAR